MDPNFWQSDQFIENVSWSHFEEILVTYMQESEQNYANFDV